MPLYNNNEGNSQYEAIHFNLSKFWHNRIMKIFTALKFPMPGDRPANPT